MNQDDPEKSEDELVESDQDQHSLNRGSAEPETRKSSKADGCLKVIGYLLIGIVLLFGFVLGACFLML